MKPPSPAFGAFALRLIEREWPEGGDATVAQAAERAVRAMQARLTRLIGRDGFRALLARARLLAKVERPALDRVEVTPEGFLRGVAEALAEAEPAEARATLADLLAAFLQVLAALVGEDLTLHLVGGGGDTGDDGSAEARATPASGGARGAGSEER